IYIMRSNCWAISTCISRRPGSLQVDAFRGHGFSLLAVAKGMSTLFAKNGFSRPSLEQLCGVFRHVLFPLESPPSVPINEGSALHDVESFKRQRTQQLEYARLLREERPR